MNSVLSTSLSSLLSHTSLDDPHQVLQASEEALKKNASDNGAQHAKVVALLKLDKWDDAIRYVESVGNSLQKKATLEYAYALYKAGRLEDAAQVAAKVPDSHAARHVEAQATYRLEDYDRTTKLYQQIHQAAVSSEEFDLRVNQGAINAQGLWLGHSGGTLGRRPSREDLEAFETTYNAACASLARGELGQAEVLLKRAKELCKHHNELTEEEKKEELLPIAVQQLYILQCQGRTAEAEELLEDLDIGAISDPATKTVAKNNAFIARMSEIETKNPFLLHKAYNDTEAIPSSADKPFSFQQIPLALNRKAIDLQAFKSGGAISDIKQSTGEAAGSVLSSDALLGSVVRAAAQSRNTADKAAIKNMMEAMQRRPENIGLAMILVQLYIVSGNVTSAISVMESLMKHLESSETSTKDLRYHPGLMSIIIALYRKQGRRNSVRRELANAAAYWRARPETSTQKTPTTLLRAAGISLLESSESDDHQKAAEIFKELYEAGSSDYAIVKNEPDKTIIAGHIASQAMTRQGAEQDKRNDLSQLERNLTPLTKLLSSVDVDALEQAGVPTNLAVKSHGTNTTGAPLAGRKRTRADASTTTPSSNKKRRLRKSRLPRNLRDLDPEEAKKATTTNTKIDAERWLPLRDRSYYRPPKSKRGAKAAGKKGGAGDDRTQGGLVSEDLDISRQTATTGDGAAAATTTTGAGAGGAKKKKGKGRK